MLWDLIRDFFVLHIFGGTDSLGNLVFTFGGQSFAWLQEEGIYDMNSTGLNDFMFKVSNTEYIGFADWLSTTATIISITIIFVLCCLFVYKIIKLIGGLIR